MTDKTANEHRDVIIIGAGVSGLGAACHLQRECPDKTYLIIEARDAIGGTWDLFRFPGIRSDSDLYTYGYEFKPWYGKPIATGEEILNYLHEVVDEHNLEPHIRFGYRVSAAVWSSDDALWTVEARNKEGESRFFTCNFLLMCQGYYNHDAGHRPHFEGEEDYKGIIVHPQQWPEDLDYDDKQMVIIGSGATAATLVPSVAERVAHVIQLQRSPSYYLVMANREEDELLDALRSLDLPDEWLYEIKRRKNVLEGGAFTHRALNEPQAVREEMLEALKEFLPDDYDLEPNFSPRYDPWRERVCLLPDGDLLKAVASGKASIVTDHIDRFVEDGILLKSGQMLATDIIVTATGIELCGLGNIDMTVDGKRINLPDTWTYKGIMISDMPNLAWIYGYARSSWTLRVDLISHFVCRLLNHMDAIDVQQCTPRLRPEDADMEGIPFTDPDDFAPGYVRRGIGRLPKQSRHNPWIGVQDHLIERETLPNATFDDGVLQFD